MAQLTEAACLIDQGAIFPHRLGLRDATGGTVLVGFKPGACSIYFDDEPIYHFDLEGRWLRAFIGCDPNAADSPKNLAGVPGRHYLKALDTATTELVRVREGNEIKIHRRSLNFTEAVEIDEHVRQMAMTLHARVASGELQPVPPPASGPKAGKAVNVAELLDFLERIAAWNPAAWSNQKEKFQATYGILPINPPLCPGPVVFQATLGDSSPEAIGFGGAATTPLYVRDPNEFKRHANEVIRLWGRRLPQARGLYLAGSDVLAQPMSNVLGFFEQVRDALTNRADETDVENCLTNPPLAPQKLDVHVVTHHLNAPSPTVEMLTEYKQRGLAHLTLGIESLCPDVRAFYDRTWSNAELAEWLTRAAEAAIPVSLAILVGAGGAKVNETTDKIVQTVEALPLAENTVIYLLDAAETADELTTARLEISENPGRLYELKERLLAVLKPRKVKVAHYTLNKEWQ